MRLPLFNANGEKIKGKKQIEAFKTRIGGKINEYFDGASNKELTDLTKLYKRSEELEGIAERLNITQERQNQNLNLLEQYSKDIHNFIVVAQNVLKDAFQINYVNEYLQIEKLKKIQHTVTSMVRLIRDHKGFIFFKRALQKSAVGQSLDKRDIQNVQEGLKFIRDKIEEVNLETYFINFPEFKQIFDQMNQMLPADKQVDLHPFQAEREPLRGGGGEEEVGEKSEEEGAGGPEGEEGEESQEESREEGAGGPEGQEPIADIDDGVRDMLSDAGEGKIGELNNVGGEGGLGESDMDIGNSDGSPSPKTTTAPTTITEITTETTAPSFVEAVTGLSSGPPPQLLTVATPATTTETGPRIRVEEDNPLDTEMPDQSPEAQDQQGSDMEIEIEIDQSNQTSSQAPPTRNLEDVKAEYERKKKKWMNDIKNYYKQEDKSLDEIEEDINIYFAAVLVPELNEIEGMTQQEKQGAEQEMGGIADVLASSAIHARETREARQGRAVGSKTKKRKEKEKEKVKGRIKLRNSRQTKTILIYKDGDEFDSGAGQVLARENQNDYNIKGYLVLRKQNQEKIIKIYLDDFLTSNLEIDLNL